MNRHSRKRTGRKSFSKAIILAVVLGIALILYNRISKNGLPKNLFSMLEQETIDPRSYTLFPETVKDSVNRVISGFWVYDSKTPEADVLTVSNRIELKDNGIMWRTTVYSIALPNGEIKKTMTVSQSYVRPFGFYKDNVNKLVCEVRTIREALITDSDTCFSPGNTDDVWVVTCAGEEFELISRKYVSFKGNDLSTFFPENSLDIIDMPFTDKKGNSETPLKKWETARKSGKPQTDASGVFAFKECSSPADELSVIRNTLIRHLSSVQGESSQAEKNITGYFVPLCLKRVINLKSLNSMEFAVSVSISQSGDISNAVIKSSGKSSAGSNPDEFIKAEISSWKTSAFKDKDRLDITFNCSSNGELSLSPAQ